MLKGLVRIALLAMLLHSADLGAQVASDIPLKSIVRVTYRALAVEKSPKPVIGQLVSRSFDSLLIVVQHDSLPSVFRVRDLDALEFSSGRSHPRRRATIIGAIGGGLVGAVYGGARTAAPENICTDYKCPSVDRKSRRRGALQGAAVGLPLGLTSGFIVGSLVGMEHWVSVRLQP